MSAEWPPLRLVLADDHPVVLGGLEQLLDAEVGFEIVATAGDGVAALAAVRRERPDVLVLDIRMPRLDGLGVLRELRDEGPPTATVLLTAGLDEEEVLEAVRLGVRGVVLKEMAPAVLVECLRAVGQGEVWIERRLVTRALDKLMVRHDGQREAAAVLTGREIDLVRQIARGLRNKEIARQLGITEGTVKVHLHNIYQKLGIDGRLALLRWAQERGLT